MDVLKPLIIKSSKNPDGEGGLPEQAFKRSKPCEAATAISDERRKFSRDQLESLDSAGGSDLEELLFQRSKDKDEYISRLTTLMLSFELKTRALCLAGPEDQEKKLHPFPFLRGSLQNFPQEEIVTEIGARNISNKESIESFLKASSKLIRSAESGVFGADKDSMRELIFAKSYHKDDELYRRFALLAVASEILLGVTETFAKKFPWKSKENSEEIRKEKLDEMRVAIFTQSDVLREFCNEEEYTAYVDFDYVEDLEKLCFFYSLTEIEYKAMMNNMRKQVLFHISNETSTAEPAQHT